MKKQYIFASLLLLILPCSCQIIGLNGLNSSSEPSQQTSLPSDVSSSSQTDSSDSSDGEIYYTKLEDSIPEGTYGQRYVEIPNSDIVIYENQSYTELEDVAAYLQFFDHIPANYVPTSQKNQATPDNDLVCTGGTFQNREGYLPSGYEYTEIDIRAGYGFSASVSRGSQRIVFGEKYGTDDISLVFYTKNHYDNYCEYLSYYQGWGEEFGNGMDDYSFENVGNVVIVDGDPIYPDFTA